MELNVFIKELEAALISRGVSETTAQKHADTLRRSFDSNDLKEIETMDTNDEIETIADSLVVLINRKKNKPEEAAVTEKSADSAPVSENAEAKAEKPTENPAEKPPLPSETEDEYFEFDDGNAATDKGKMIFWAGLVLTSPITICLLALVFGTFLALFAGVGVLIVGLVVLMVALIAAGAACSLVGIIYGITQLFSFVAAGVYEIGLAIIVAGVVLLVSVILYNFAIRFLPFVINKLGVFLGFVCRKLKSLFLNIRREVYRL